MNAEQQAELDKVLDDLERDMDKGLGVYSARNPHATIWCADCQETHAFLYFGDSLREWFANHQRKKAEAGR